MYADLLLFSPSTKSWYVLDINLLTLSKMGCDVVFSITIVVIVITSFVSCPITF